MSNSQKFLPVVFDAESGEFYTFTEDTEPMSMEEASKIADRLVEGGIVYKSSQGKVRKKQMFNIKFQRHIQEFLLNLNDEGVDIRKNYSGRGMYGKNCVGVVYDNPNNFWADLIDSLEFHNDEDLQHEISDLMRHTKTDSMGLQMILYWEGWQWDHDLNDADECTDEEFEDDEE